MADEKIGKEKQTLTLENILNTALKAPMVKVDREAFLRKELKKDCTEKTIDEAVRFNPARAGVPRGIINRISLDIINRETAKVTAVSVAASLPGSAVPLAAAGAAAADITSYFVYTIRTAQELAYLYGFDQFKLYEDVLDSEDMDFMMIFLGVVFGVHGAGEALNKAVDTAAARLSGTLSHKPDARAAVQPVIRQLAAKIGTRITRQVLADTVASGIPVLGSVASGGLTFMLFRPRCMKLRKHLMNCPLCDPAFYKKRIRKPEGGMT